MLAMQHRLVVIRVVDAAHAHRFRRLGLGQFLPRTKAHPKALLARGALNVIEPDVAAVLLQFVLHVGSNGQGLRPRQVNPCILQLVAIEDADRH